MQTKIPAAFLACAFVLGANSSAAQSDSSDLVPPDDAGNIVLTKLKTPSGDPATIATSLEKLIGTWHQSPDNFSDAAKAWMKENHISDFYDTFARGTDKAWIDFGDYRVVNGEPRKTGVGMISWHAGWKHLRFRESGARGGYVDGMLEVVDDQTFVRHFEFFAPDGSVSYRSDTWSFSPDDTSCFTWQTTVYEDKVPKPQAPRVFCKRE
ncbi:MAG: hypothetical protein AB8G16_17945 [Gammaproteobacteria bacterium]